MLRKVEASNPSVKGEVRKEFVLQQEIEASLPQDRDTSPDQSSSGQACSVSVDSVSRYNEILKSQGLREPVYHVHQVMSRSVVSVAPEFTLERVYETFEQYPFKILPVVEHGQPVAAISRAQLYRLLLTNPAPGFRATRLASLFEEHEYKVITTDPVTDIRRAATVMFEEKLEALPVVTESGQVVGIISNTDILNCVVKDPPLSVWA